MNKKSDARWSCERWCGDEPPYHFHCSPSILASSFTFSSSFSSSSSPNRTPSPKSQSLDSFSASPPATPPSRPHRSLSCLSRERSTGPPRRRHGGGSDFGEERSFRLEMRAERNPRDRRSNLRNKSKKG